MVELYKKKSIKKEENDVIGILNYAISFANEFFNEQQATECMINNHWIIPLKSIM